jgi:cell division protein FtsL
MRAKSLAKILIIACFVLAVFELSVANRLTSAGLILKEISQKEEELEEENESLESKVASASSLTRLARRAQESGFVKPQIIYLTPSLPVAMESFNGNSPR